MDNALNDGNLETLAGQTSEDVGQEEGGQQQNNSIDWQEQAKYFQSEKDKVYAENQNLKKYEQIGKLMESRPDIANAVVGMVDGGGQPSQEKVSLSKEDFDPWEAYNDPNSESYKYREQELSDKIQAAVNVNMQGVQQKMGMQNLERQLQDRGLTETEVASFFEFANQNPADHGVDGAIAMWQAVTQGNQPNQAQQGPNPLDAVRNTQRVPQQAGVLQGGKPQSKPEDAKRWEGVLKASRVGNKVP